MPNKETKFKAKHVAILREALVRVHRVSNPMLQKEIMQTLEYFALSVKEYCQCEDSVYVKGEDKFICLNCGKRHDPPVKVEG